MLAEISSLQVHGDGLGAEYRSCCNIGWFWSADCAV